MAGILITGASSGLGEALALAYAAPGVRLVLSGRDGQRLQATLAACLAKGAAAEGRVLDVRDGEAMRRWVREADAAGGLDLVIANAGISAGTGSHDGESAEQTEEIFAVNLEGVLNTVLPVLEPMRRRRSGQIALMASLAAFRGMPSAPAYCASKAAVRIWGEGLRGLLDPDGVKVSVICPGFVTTRMTAVNRFPMPFLMSAERAAEHIRRGLAANRARIAFPWPMAAMAWLLGAVPPGWSDPWLSRLPGKE